MARRDLDADLARCLVEGAPDVLLLVDEGGRIVFANAQTEALLGYGSDELVGQLVEKLIPSQARAEHAALRAGFTAAPVTRRMGERKALAALKRDGSELPVEVSLSPVEVVHGRYVVAALRDATERARTESALRGAAAYTRAAIEQAPDAMFTADLAGRYTDVNAAACRLLGYGRDELIGKTIMDLLPPEEIPRLQASRARLLAPGSSESSEWRLRRKEGAFIPVEVSATILSDGRWQAIVRDISERKRVESLLLLHAIIVDELAEGIVLVRASDDSIVYTNPRFDQILGYQRGELIGKPFWTLNYHDEAKDPARVAEKLLERLDHEKEVTTELRNVKKDGTPIWCRARVVAFEHPELGPVWVAVHEDITEQREAKEATQSLQARLVLADRMSSLGTLAAGVAHEINNPLTYVISNLELMARAVRDLGRDPRPSDTQPLLQMIEEASQGADRVRRIVKGLRAFSRADEDHPVSLDVQEVVESSINMTLHRLRQRARMVTEFERVPPVRADEAQLGQVFINLLVNAAQAIPEGNVQNNQIRVAVRNHPGDQVVVEVRDTGEGIPPDILGHIFDPFFTTKAVGEGTGLGLSISHGIVTSLGGRIEVESAIGEGSVFRIFLPAGAPAPSLPPGRPPPRPSSQEPSATVLVVDDDPMVAKAIQRSLDGCQVTLSANGREALELLASGRRFDLILCDLMMPVMTGMELHAQLAERLPEMVPRMVFMTGGAFTNGARSFLDRVPNRRIEKPFEAARLRALVAEMANNR